MIRRPPLGWLLLAWLLGCLLQPAAAAPGPDLTQMHHTAWRVGDGAPGPVLALAQTPDGWLWVGTATGLFRFDGHRFERVESLGGVRLASPAITSLVVDRRGALWIGFLYGGVGRWSERRFTVYGEPEGLPPNTVLRIGFAPDGSVWAAAVKGLYRLQGHRWERVGAHDMVLGVAFDRAGHLWLDAEQQLLRWDGERPPGTGDPRVVGKTVYDTAASLQQGPDGALWQVDSTGAPRRYGADGQPLPGPTVPAGRVEPLTFDRDGNAWFAGPTELHCVPVAEWLALAPGAPLAAGLPVKQLSGLVNVILQDQEGSIWLGTQGGLDRLRPHKLTVLPPLQEAPPFALAPAADGALWVGTSMLGLLRLDRQGRWHPVVQGLQGNVDAVARAPDGGVWFGTGDGQLWRVAAGAAARVAAPVAVDSKLPVQSLAVDARGRLWLGGGGLFRRKADGSWQPLQAQGLPASSPLVMAADAAGRVWAGYSNNRLAEIGPDDRVRLYGPAEGLNVGTVTALHVHGDRVWIGGSTGVQLLRGGRLRLMQGATGALSHGVAGVLERADGEMWVHGADGVVRVPATEVARFLASPGHRPDFERFDHLDGVPGPPEQTPPLPSMVEAEDGRLWFAATDALSWIDPRHIRRNPLAPKVEVLGLRAGGEGEPLRDGLALPRGTTRVEIEYTALSLAMPERLRFRYRLDGVDSDWQDAGHQRTASYNNLGPGPYRFQVMASNEDGQWNPQGATLAFSIEPAYYQTWPFRIACGLALLGLLVLLYRLRERQLASRAMERLRIRQLERERIAADLHDTLLQGIHGLLLRMEGVLHELREPAARESVQAAVELAEHLVEEGRDRVSGLRAAAVGIGDIAEALKDAAQRLEREQRLPVRLSVEGQPAPLAPETQEQLYLVAREAMRNAALHSGGSRLEVRLRYEDGALQLEVGDDGQGIPPAVQESGGREGHWGLEGMRERTRWMQGRIEIVSRAGEGTTVRVRVPLRRPDAVA